MADDLSLDISGDVINLTVESPEIDLTLDINSFQANAAPSYVHMQTQESDSWTINHNLGYKPIVQVFNSGSIMVWGSVIHTSDNQAVVSFSIPLTGFARLI